MILAAAFLPGGASTPNPGATASANGQGDPPRGAFVAVVGGTLIDGTGAPPIPDSAIIIEGNRVRAAGPRRQVRIPPGSVPVDATDRYVIPGLVDMHVHLLEGVVPGDFLRWGVTTVRHLGDTSLEWITGLKERVESGAEAGPRIFHCGMFVVSEPPLQPEKYPPQDLKTFLVMRAPEDAARIVKTLVDAGADVVKVKTEMNPAWLKPLCASAVNAGLPVAFDNAGERGHYDALQALEAGAVSVEHLNGIPFDDQQRTEAILSRMILAKAFAVPTFVVLDRTFSKERVMVREEFMRRFAAQGGVVLAGTDVPARGLPAGRALHAEIARLAIAGLGNEGALAAATGAAGRALGYQGLVGTIEAGSYADLVILSADPLRDVSASERILSVFKDGREVWNAAAEGAADPSSH